MNATFLSGLDFNTPSWDLFIFLFFIVATFVYGFTLGRTRIILLLLSTYMALAVVHALTLADPSATQSLTVGTSPFFIVQITAFIGALLLIFFFLSGSALRRSLGAEEVHGKAWQIILLSILQAGFMIASVLSFIPVAERAGLLGVTRNFFVSNTALLFWTVLPVIAMMLIKDEKDEH